MTLPDPIRVPHCLDSVRPLKCFPGGVVVKNLPTKAGDPRDRGWIPGWGRSPGEGNRNALQYFCLQNSMDRGVWQATVPGVGHNWAHTHTRIRPSALVCPGHLQMQHPEISTAGQVSSVPQGGQSLKIILHCAQNAAKGPRCSLPHPPQSTLGSCWFYSHPLSDYDISHWSVRALYSALGQGNGLCLYSHKRSFSFWSKISACRDFRKLQFFCSEY